MCVCVHIPIGIEPGETTGEKANEEGECGWVTSWLSRCVLQGVTVLV